MHRLDWGRAEGGESERKASVGGQEGTREYSRKHHKGGFEFLYLPPLAAQWPKLKFSGVLGERQELEKREQRIGLRFTESPSVRTMVQIGQWVRVWVGEKVVVIVTVE